MNKNESEIKTILDQNTRKYMNVLKFDFETILFLIGFIINIIKYLNIFKIIK